MADDSQMEAHWIPYPGPPWGEAYGAFLRTGSMDLLIQPKHGEIVKKEEGIVKKVIRFYSLFISILYERDSIYAPNKSLKVN